MRWNHARAGELHRPQQFGLHNVPRRLAVGAHGPTFNRRLKSTARPPRRIHAGEVTRQFVRTRFRFPDPVRGHKQALFEDLALSKKLQVARIQKP